MNENNIVQLPDSRNLQGGEATQHQRKPCQSDDRSFP